MGPKMCVFVAFNGVMFFALVSGSPTPNPPVTNTSAATTSDSPRTSCPRDVIKLGVCAGVLNGWMNFTTGFSQKTHCCSVIEGLYDYQVAVCFCTALKANIMGFDVNIPISFTELINTCKKNVPEGYVCT